MSAPRKPRVIRHSPTPVVPLALTQRNVEAATGVPPWRYLQLCAERGIGRRIGKLHVCPADAFLRALQIEPQPEPHEVEAVPETPIDFTDQVLAAVGWSRT